MKNVICCLPFVALVACQPTASAPPAAVAPAVGGPVWGHVEIVTAPDGRVAQVAPGPDGSEIRVDGIVVVGGQGRPGRPVFSPDGQRLAFVSGETGVASLWILDLASRVKAQLTNIGLKPGAGMGPAYVPPPVRAGSTLWTDAGQLVWDAGDSVWTCRDDGGGCRRLLPTTATPTSAQGGAVTLLGPDGVGRRVLLDS